jgi:hypothetical protein
LKLRFLSRYRSLAWRSILRRAIFLPTTEVNSVSTLRRIVGACCPTTARARLQIVLPAARADGPTRAMKPNGRRSCPVAPADAVADGAAAKPAPLRFLSMLRIPPAPSGAWARLPGAARSFRLAPEPGTTQDRFAGASAPSCGLVAGSTGPRSGEMVVIGTVVTSSEAAPAAGARRLFVFAETPLLYQKPVSPRDSQDRDLVLDEPEGVPGCSVPPRPPPPPEPPPPPPPPP